MRKILVTLLAISMLLGLVGPALASTFSDVTNNPHVDKAAAFGWIRGYEDGTFKPSGNITRAEAATVIVRALGLEAAAEAAKGLESRFPDVPATHWASGYVNVCTTRGILKGYPDGTFKPEANITGAEIITMIVRALNREFQAVGDWPIGHITVAAAERIIGTGFVANALATRGQVAEWASKASEVVHGELTANGWAIPQPPAAQKTFVSASGFEYNAAVDLVDVTSVDTTGLFINGNKLADNYKIAGGVALKDLMGYKVKLFWNDEKTRVHLIEVTERTTVKTGSIRLMGANYFYIYNEDTRYEFAPTFQLFRNEVELAGTLATFAANFAVDHSVEIFRDANGKVTTLKSTVFDKSHQIVLATSTTGTTVTTWNVQLLDGATTTTYFMASDAVVKVDGVVTTLKDVKADMIASIRLDAANRVRYLEAFSNKVSGKITAKRAHQTNPAVAPTYYVSIDGVEYTLESAPTVKGVAYVNAATTYGLLGVNDIVTVHLSGRGRAKLFDLTATVANRGKVLAFIEAAGPSSYDKWVLDVRGVSTTYEVAKTGGVSDHIGLTVTDGIAIGDYVNIATNDDGRLFRGVGGVVPVPMVNTGVGVGEPVTYGAPVQNIYTADRLIQVNNTFYTVGDQAVIYVDGVYGTFSQISKNNRVWYVVHATEPRLEFLLVSTHAKFDSSRVAAKANWTIDSLNDACEPFATVRFFADAAKTNAIGWWDATPAAYVTTPHATTNRGRLVNVRLDPADIATHFGAAATEATIYIEVTNEYGMSVTAAFKVVQ